MKYYIVFHAVWQEKLEKSCFLMEWDDGFYPLNIIVANKKRTVPKVREKKVYDHQRAKNEMIGKKKKENQKKKGTFFTLK
jgi:hypothetical protein